MKRTALGLLAIACLAGCGSAPAPQEGAVGVRVRLLAPLELQTGATLRFAGGLELSAPRNARFGGFSGLEAWPDGRFVTISDAGSWMEGRLRLDAQGRLAGVEAVRLASLRGPDGKPLRKKLRGDAEGLAALPDGRLAVSFEQRHRIWIYGSITDAARPGPLLPQSARLARNEGLEALAAWRGGILACAERRPGGGGAWFWRSNGAGVGAVVQGPMDASLSPAFSLVGLDALPERFGGDLVALERFFAPLVGGRARLRRVSAAGLLAGRFEGPIVAELAGPDIDNFEGVAAVETPEGARLYLISDDNFRHSQRTLLVALDWPLPSP